jgi:hypothetical protein
MLEIGEYRASARAAVLGTTKNGTEQVAVTFDLLDLPGQTITWYGFFSEKAEEIAFRGLRAAGFAGADLSDLASLQPGPECVLVIDHETYEGKVRAKVKFINRGGAGIPVKSQLDPGSAKAFAARMKGRILAFDQGAGSPPLPKPAAKPTPRAPASDSPPQGLLDQQAGEQGDDIPF